MTEQISLQMEGNTCTITIPNDAYLRVKVYAPRRQFPVLEGKKTTATITLFQGETMRVDAYGEGGEGDLLKTSFVLTEQGLVEQKKNLSREVEVVVLPEQTDSPGYEELDDEEQGRQEDYLRKAGYPIDTALNLSAESLVTQEPQEPAMRYCSSCGGHHYVIAGEWFCPLDVNRPLP